MYTDDINIKLRALTSMYADLATKIDGLRESITELDRRVTLMDTQAWEIENELVALDPLSSLRNRE